MRNYPDHDYTIEIEFLPEPIRYDSGETASVWVRIYSRTALSNTGRFFADIVEADRFADGVAMGISTSTKTTDIAREYVR